MLIATLLAAAALAAAPVPSADSKTVAGEVVDMFCYMTHGRSGPKHSKCAKACVDSGAPAGLLDDQGGLYLLVTDHLDVKPLARARALAGGRARITGTVSDKGGVRALVVTAAEKE